MSRPLPARIRAVPAITLLLAAVPLSAQSPGTVYRVPVTGVVELGLAPFIERSIEEAAAAGMEFVVLDMDTPGGRVDAAERIADAIGDSRIPVYTLVNRRAFSAGALIALATRGIYMRPGSVIGAATPVDGSGQKAPEKIVSARDHRNCRAQSQSSRASGLVRTSCPPGPRRSSAVSRKR